MYLPMPETFTGSANDTQDGVLTGGLGWVSSLQGGIGGGGSFSTSALGVGTHTITASVSDVAGLSGSTSIQVTVTAAPKKTARVNAISYSQTGARKKDLSVKVTVIDEASAVVPNATVTLTISGPGGPYTSTLTTSSTGTGTAQLLNAPSGTYSSSVSTLAATGYTALTTTPTNSYTKK